MIYPDSDFAIGDDLAAGTITFTWEEAWSSGKYYVWSTTYGNQSPLSSAELDAMETHMLGLASLSAITGVQIVAIVRVDP